MKTQRNQHSDGRCEEVRSLLSPYIDGRTSEADARLVEEHLAGCAECLLEMEHLRLVIAGLRVLPQVRPNRSFALQGVPVRAVSPPGPSNLVYLRRLAMTLAASLVLLFGLGLQARGGSSGAFLLDRSLAGAPVDRGAANGALPASERQAAPAPALVAAPVPSAATGAATGGAGTAIAEAGKTADAVAAAPAAATTQPPPLKAVPAPAALAPTPAAGVPLAAAPAPVAPASTPAAARPAAAAPAATETSASAPPSVAAAAPPPAAQSAADHLPSPVQVPTASHVDGRGAAPVAPEQAQSAAGVGKTAVPETVPQGDWRESLWQVELSLALGLLLVGVAAMLGRTRLRP